MRLIFRYNQHFKHLARLPPLATDSGLHFYSDCVDDGGRRAHASWRPEHRCVHIEPTSGTYEKPCLWPPYSIPGSICCLLAAFQGSEANIVGVLEEGGGTSSLRFIQSVGRLAKRKQPDAVHRRIYYSGLSTKAQARASESFW